MIEYQGYPTVEPMRSMKQPLHTLVVTSLLLLLSGCGLFSSSDDAPTPDSSAQPPVETPDPLTGTPPEEEAAETPVPDNVQVYQDDSGMFALALPKGYTHEKTDQGITFTSEDEGFAGEIVYESDPSATTNLYALEKQLKDIIEARFGTVDWDHNGQRQPDGSVRLAWDTTDEDGRDIDALSFIEVHGQNRFALLLYSVDQAYNDYGDDAKIIAGTYVVRQGPAIANTDATEADDAETESRSEANTES